MGDFLVCLFLWDFNVLFYHLPWSSSHFYFIKCHCFLQASKSLLTTLSLLSKGPSQGIKCYVLVECFHINKLFLIRLYNESPLTSILPFQCLTQSPNSCSYTLATSYSSFLFFANSISLSRLSCDLTLITILVTRRKARVGIRVWRHNGL